jgi:hypothetical protein
VDVERVPERRRRRQGRQQRGMRGRRDGKPEQPVVKLQLHSAGDASPLTALLLAHIWTICSVVAPGPGVPAARTLPRGADLRGAWPPSVRRWSFTTDCQVIASSAPLPAASPRHRAADR